MIGIDPKTGMTVTGVSALACRFTRLLTTSPASRVKRRDLCNRAVERIGEDQNPTEAMIIQNLTLEALANPGWGLTEFKATQCKAVPGNTGFQVTVWGEWRGQPLELKGRL